MTEKELYAVERKKDAHIYLVMLTAVILSFINFPLFSFGSILPALVILFWACGISRQSKIQNYLLLESKPIVEKLVSSGMSEHDAMKKCGIDKFYYKPFWAIR